MAANNPPVQGVATTEPNKGSKAPNVMHVRCVPGEDHVLLWLNLGDERKSFYRSTTEKLDRIRYRLQLLAASAEGDSSTSLHSGGNGGCSVKKKKKSKQAKKKRDNNHESSLDAAPADSTDPSANDSPPRRSFAVKFFTSDGSEVTAKNATIGDTLLETTRVTIGDEVLTVRLNQPLLTNVTIVEPLLVGIPVMPAAKTEFCDPDDCTWNWFCLDDGETTVENGNPYWSHRRFTPSLSDVGRRFLIECQAPSTQYSDEEDSKISVVTAPVVMGPDRGVFAKRRAMGREPAAERHDRADAFRVMSYNVLFDGYTTSVHAKRNLFPYASRSVVKESYRAQLVFQEISESKPDVVCLQEVGEIIFQTYFEPMMNSLGFHSFYSGKTGTTREGCASFIQTASFRVVNETTLDLAAAVQRTKDASVRALLAEFPDIATGLYRVPSIAQILVLEPVSANCGRIILSNTHLFYREDSHLIRLVQVTALIQHLDAQRQAQLASGYGQAGIVMCGDFNASPGTAAVDFLLNGIIDSTHRHWRSAPSFRWDRALSDESADDSCQSDTNDKHDKVSPGHFEHPFDLVSACGIPDFTNFAGNFVGTLDYVLVDDNLFQVDDVFPSFTLDEVSEEVALPSSKFPSDHISLLCDLSWKEPPQR